LVLQLITIFMIVGASADPWNYGCSTGDQFCLRAFRGLLDLSPPNWIVFG
jgi:hypothetical protein